MYSINKIKKIMRLFNFNDLYIDNASVIKYEEITADTNAYVIMTSDRYDKFFVLYGEDHIEDIEQISQNVDRWFPFDKMHFIEPINNLNFKDTKGSEFYINPDIIKINEWIKYAIEDGTNYMFLIEIYPSKKNISYWTESDRLRLNDDA
jgi:hypothetical protein